MPFTKNKKDHTRQSRMMMCALIVLTKAPAHLDTCFSQADLVRDLFPQRAVGVLSVLEHHLQLAQLLR